METTEEIWLPVKGFEGRFKISNHGRVISINGKYLGEKILSPAIDNGGYYQCQLRNVTINKRVRVHTLVAEHFIGPKPPGKRMTVNHKDTNKLNNYFENLEWVEYVDNLRHAASFGLMPRGEKIKNSKMTEDGVIQMRKFFAENSCSHTELGKMFNISRRQASDIVKRKNWAWLA